MNLKTVLFIVIVSLLGFTVWMDYEHKYIAEYMEITENAR